MTILHEIGEWLRNALLLIPLSAVRAAFLVMIAAVMLWVVTLPRQQTQSPDASGAAGNLKIWACLALALQLWIYWKL